MNRTNQFEQHLPESMAELAGARVPDYIDDILRETARTRQRPAWSSLERWLPMDLVQPRVSTRARPIVVFAVLVLVGLLVAASLLIYVGSHPQRVPAPFGPAANGLLYYSSADGDLFSVDPAKGAPTAVLTGPTSDTSPLPSRDGQRIVFTRTAAGGDQLVVADPDGSNVRTLAGIYTDFSEIDWSPTNRQIAIVSTVGGVPSLSILEVDGSGARILPLGLEVHNIWYLPDGSLVFHGTKTESGGSSYGLYVVNADGTGLRPILPPTSGATDWEALGASPDGRSLAYHRWQSPSEEGRLHIVDIATGTDRPIVIAGTVDGEHHEAPLFSPDGTHLLFTRYAAGSGDATLAVVPVGGGVAISIGPSVPYETSPIAGYSPDGRSILAYYPGTKELWLLDPTGGQAGGDRRVSIPVSDIPTWQRLAP